MNILDLIASAAQGNPQAAQPQAAVQGLPPPTVSTTPAPLNPNPTPNTDPVPVPQNYTAAQDVAVTAPAARTIAPDDRDQPSPRKTDELIPRHGLFGVKGTLRDVLGTLGDAFLIGSGKQAIYAPARNQERTESAMYGFNADDPQAANDAISRLSLVNPDAALNLYGKVAQHALVQQQVGASQAAQAQTQQKTKALGLQYIGSMAGAVTPSNKPQMIARMQQVSDQFGLGYQFDPNMSQDDLDAITRTGMTPAEQSKSDDDDQKEADTKEYRQAMIANQAARTAAYRQAASARAAASAGQVANGAARNAETARHNRFVEAHPKASGKSSILDQLRAGNPRIPPPPGGAMVRKIN